MEGLELTIEESYQIYVQGKRRSPSRASQVYNQTPYPTEMLRGLKHTLCTTGPRDPTETETELCLGVSWGGPGQQWPQDWQRSVFIPIAKKSNARECLNYRTIALISHASKVMLKLHSVLRIIQQQCTLLQDSFSFLIIFWLILLS